MTQPSSFRGGNDCSRPFSYQNHKQKSQKSFLSEDTKIEIENHHFRGFLTKQLPKPQIGRYPA